MGIPLFEKGKVILFIFDSESRCRYGGILTIDTGTSSLGFQLMDRLQNTEQFGLIAVSLGSQNASFGLLLFPPLILSSHSGYFDTLMSMSASSTSSEMTDEDMKKSG